MTTQSNRLNCFLIQSRRATYESLTEQYMYWVYVRAGRDMT